MKKIDLFLIVLILTILGCSPPESSSNNTHTSPSVVKLEITESQDTIETIALEEPVVVDQVEKEIEISISGENEPCDCKFLINWKYQGDVILLDSLGVEIEKLRNDPETENYLIGVVQASDSSAFKVRIKNALDDEDRHGYLKKNEFLGAFLNNYSSEPINVYDELVDDMEYSNQIIEYDPSFFQIIDCRKGWSKLAKNGELIGWVMNRYICSSPYTTCN